MGKEQVAGLCPASPPPLRGKDGVKALVVVVRVPARVAAALAFGEGSVRGWVDDALGVMFAGDLDDGGAWGDEVRARFGVTNADADAFDATAAGFLDADGEEVRAVSAILAGRAVCFPDADGKGG